MTLGTPLDRVDGRLKVTGSACYAAEWSFPNLAYAVLVTSASGPGEILSLETTEASRMPGVLGILTDLHPVFQGPEIAYFGQPVAVAVADSLETATEAAERVRLEVESRPPRLELDEFSTFAPESLFGEPPDVARGDFNDSWLASEIRVDSTTTISWEHHNPIEPHATIARWEDGNTLTLYDSSQWVHGVRDTVAAALRLKPEQVRVLSPFVGGAFGCKGVTWPHVICAAIAARQVGRTVKLVLTRKQMYGSVGFRPAIKQRVRLCATREGKLTGIAHDGINGTSARGIFVEPVGLATRMLYSCPNVTVTHRLIRLDTQTPTYMRAPGEATGTFALESAMDELAYLLGLDPLELRLINYAEKDEDLDLPWSSKGLRECYEQGALRFGWKNRNPRPGSMRDGRMLLGWGTATATYPTNMSPADASLRLRNDGQVLAKCATEDLGTGAYTVLTQIVADSLALSPERVVLELGDTNFPRGPIAAGSQTTASVGCALAAAGQFLIGKLCELAVRDPGSPLFGADRKEIIPLCGRLVRKSAPGLGESYEDLMNRQGLPFMEEEGHFEGEGDARFSSHAFGAQFAEVRIDPDLSTIRVSRFVGAFAAGRIANAKTARSQLMGGITMGIGLALMEKGVRDPRWGRVVNADLADYLVPVNADVPPIEAFFVAEEDAHVNPLGLKGLGELGITGAGAAIANAVFHATGKRIRDLPITLEQLL